MGKKEKKDLKPPPEDIFDLLQIETRQAHTAVLLLDSTEEDVLCSSCESIYKFADKCEDNKKTLLDLGSVAPLLNLTQHEDPLVRKNATAALGVLSLCADVRRHLRKLDNAVSVMINLLSPQEDATIQEFSALFLSQMAQEYTSKITILDNLGMEPLVRGLSSNDPDVQKNCIEAIALLLMDYKGRESFRENGGLPAAYNLITSEYAIIQQLSVLVLYRAAQDAQCRLAMHELDMVTKMVNILQRPEWKDLHVQCVQVIACLLEDPETLIQIKDCGGISKLISLVTDQVPPEDETKKDKKGPPKSGKKGSKPDAKKKEEDKEEKDDKIIPTLPDVKICAAEALARVARNSDNRRLLHEMEGEKMLVLLLSHESVDVQTSAAFALGVMAEFHVSKDIVRELGGIPLLVKMLSLEQEKGREASTYALANLTCENQKNCVEVEKAGGLDLLISLLNDPCMAALGNSCSVLINLSADDSLRELLVSKRITEALVYPISCNNIEIQAKGALTLSAFACDADSRMEFRASGGLDILVPLLKSEDDTVRKNACWAISVCAVDELSSTEICHLGGMEILVNMQNCEQKKTMFTDIALDKVLNTNLSAKFSYVGHLSSVNIMTDGFYDAGCITPSRKFLTLAQYMETEVNDKRAVILVNAMQESASQPSVPEQEIKPTPSKNNLSGKSSRSGRESKMKGRSNKDKEEQLLREELEQQKSSEESKEVKQGITLVDKSFVRYIDHVKENIEPLATSREQAIALAKYVSIKMGGSIEKENVSLTSWELPISQTKKELGCNVIPIGYIKVGIHCHRALLFKALADRIALPCSLVRGDYNRSTNEILLPIETDDQLNPVYPACLYIIDLMHEPGRLMLADGPEAVIYKTI